MKAELIALLITLPILLAGINGRIAKDFKQSFWYWFLISIPLPIVSGGLLFYAIYHSRKPKPVENHEIFDHLFISNKQE